MLKVKQINRTIVLMLIFFISNFMVVIAQENDTNNKVKSSELISVESKPSGSIVQIEGLYDFTGRTPFVIPYPIRGRYKIKATKEGYESVTTNMNFVGGGEKNLLIKLKPKTRFKAAYRSLFFPGWGQIYGGNKFRGVVISSLQIALGIRSLIAINDYNNAQDEFERTLDRFNRNMSNLENAEVAFQEVQDKLKDAEDAYNFRKTMLIITASFWAYNILDSIFFFSSKNTQIEIRTNRFSHNFVKNKLTVSLKIGL